MKKLLLLLLLFVYSSSLFSQNNSYDERKASLEERKEAKRKAKEEYRSESGIVYAVGDTITIYGKLERYEGVKTGGRPLRHWRNPKDIKVIIHKFDKYINTKGDYKLVKATCKGVEKGRYNISIEKAYSNCEIQLCE